MNNDYFLKHILEKGFEDGLQTQAPGPVITIAREYGCYSSQIADMLADRLSEIQPSDAQEWHWLSNEILTEAAKNLEVTPEQISHIFGAEEKNFLRDIIESFSVKEYVCDSHIKNTIMRVVRKYADKGNVIIVGRAGCVITNHIEHALHVKLIAPFEWRVKRIQDRFDISSDTARKQVLEVDEKRKTFLSFYGGDKPDGDLFDAVYNRAHLTEEEIVESIVRIAQMRQFV